MACCMQRFRWTPSSVFCVFEQFFKEFPRYCNVSVSKSSFTSNFQKTMRRLSFSFVILIAVILAFVVQDAYLLSPWGRRFGRSATKKHRNERIRQVHSNEREETSHIKDERCWYVKERSRLRFDRFIQTLDEWWIVWLKVVVCQRHAQGQVTNQPTKPTKNGQSLSPTKIHKWNNNKDNNIYVVFDNSKVSLSNFDWNKWLLR